MQLNNINDALLCPLIGQHNKIFVEHASGNSGCVANKKQSIVKSDINPVRSFAGVMKK